jgi:hypothetical protein
LALATVVSGPFYEQMIGAIPEIAQRKGPFTLVMLLPSNALDARWNAVFSAKWLDPFSLGEAVRSMSNELKASLPDSAFIKIQHISILRTTRSFVREITSDLDSTIKPDTAYLVRSFVFSRFDVDEAVVFAAEPPAPAQDAQDSKVHNSHL